MSKRSLDGKLGCSVPVVSVAMITFNHAKYITQAIESVLAQRTSFFFELVIGEDSSKDDTGRIVDDYVTAHPTRIRVVRSSTNVGMHANMRRVLAQCQGRYVAFLEGDDYWLDPSKLQRQVELLESNPALVASFHRVLWMYTDGRPLVAGGPAHGSDWPAAAPTVASFADIANEVFIQTGSVVYRRKMLPDLPSWVDRLPWGDWVVFLVLASRGGFGFLPETMSAYRQHSQGATARFNDRDANRAAADMFMQLIPCVDPNLRPICRRMAVKHLEMLAETLEREQLTGMAIRVLVRAAWLDLRLGRIRSRPLVWSLRLAFPELHRRFRALP